MNFGTRRSEEVLTVCGAAVLAGLGIGDLVVERTAAADVGPAEGAGVDVVEEADVKVVGGAEAWVANGTLAPAPAQPATINEKAATPAREHPAYQRCCPTGTHGSEWNHAKWSKLGMMAW
jgi:hypothetical protein